MAKSCAESVREAFGPGATDRDVEGAIVRINKLRERARVTGETFNQDYVAKVIKRDADEAKATVRRAKIDAIIHTRLTAKLAQFKADGLTREQSVLALLEGTHRRTTGGSRSVYAEANAQEAVHVGAMMAELDAALPHLKKAIDDKTLNADIAVEMSELRVGGKPGRTGNRDARDVAKIFAKYIEAARLEANRFGATIGRLDGYVPQVHDASRLVNVAGKTAADKANAWTDIILPMLDIERSFPGLTVKEVRAELAAIHTEIVTGIPRENASSNGPANLANSLGKERVLHFATIEGRNVYDAQFGAGNLFKQVMEHQRGMSRAIGKMSVLGTNPAAMIGKLADHLKEDIRLDKTITPAAAKKQGALLNTDAGAGHALGNAIAELTGASLQTGPYETLAKIAATARVWQSVTKLGGMVLAAAPTDTLQIGVAAAFRGSSFFGAIGRQVGALARGRGTAEGREAAFLCGQGYEGLLGHAMNSRFALDGGSGHMAKMSETFFKWTGMGFWDDVSRAGVARSVAAEMAIRVKTPWADLPRRYTQVLDQHGFTPEIWGKLAGAGGDHLTPDAVRNIPGLSADEASDLAVHVASFVGAEVRNSILSVSAKTSRQVKQGTHAGTVTGEFLRMITQFKSFSLEAVNGPLSRSFHGAETGGQMAANIGTLIASTIVAGYTVSQLKSLARGEWPPRNPLDKKVIADAMLHGGGLGIYGDFLLSDVSRFGNSVLETAAGPAAATAANIWTILHDAVHGSETKAGKLLNTALSNTPFVNLFYLRPALNALVLDRLQEMASPGYGARKAERLRQNNQHRLY